MPSSKPIRQWDTNRHTITILKRLLWPLSIYWCEKCKRQVPARRTPGEIYALERAIRKLGGHITRAERKQNA